MKIVAVIPVKEISERVKSKNLRDFYNGESLLKILIKKQGLNCHKFPIHA